MHMHVTGFSAATILVFAIASPSRAQGIEVFGAGPPQGSVLITRSCG